MTKKLRIVPAKGGVAPPPRPGTLVLNGFGVATATAPPPSPLLRIRNDRLSGRGRAPDSGNSPGDATIDDRRLV